MSIVDFVPTTTDIAGVFSDIQSGTAFSPVNQMKSLTYSFNRLLPTTGGGLTDAISAVKNDPLATPEDIAIAEGVELDVSNIQSSINAAEMQQVNVFSELPKNLSIMNSHASVKSATTSGFDPCSAFNEFLDDLNDIASKITSTLAHIGEFIENILEQVANAVAQGLAAIVAMLATVANKFSEVISELGQSIGDALSEISNKINDITNKISNYINGAVSDLVNWAGAGSLLNILTNPCSTEKLGNLAEDGTTLKNQATKIINDER